MDFQRAHSPGCRIVFRQVELTFEELSRDRLLFRARLAVFSCTPWKISTLQTHQQTLCELSSLERHAQDTFATPSKDRSHLLNRCCSCTQSNRAPPALPAAILELNNIPYITNNSVGVPASPSEGDGLNATVGSPVRGSADRSFAQDTLRRRAGDGGALGGGGGDGHVGEPGGIQLGPMGGRSGREAAFI